MQRESVGDDLIECFSLYFDCDHIYFEVRDLSVYMYVFGMFLIYFIYRLCNKRKTHQLLQVNVCWNSVEEFYLLLGFNFAWDFTDNLKKNIRLIIAHSRRVWQPSKIDMLSNSKHYLFIYLSSTSQNKSIWVDWYTQIWGYLMVQTIKLIAENPN